MLGSDFEKDPRRIQEKRMRPVADMIYRSTWGNDIIIERGATDLDKYLGIDIRIKLNGGVVLTGQEKFLSTKYASHHSITVEYMQNPTTQEQGDWFKLACQFYFVGYITKDWQHFDPWMILDWPVTMMATARGNITWRDNANGDGHARASFRYCDMYTVPFNCIIATSITRQIGLF